MALKLQEETKKKSLDINVIHNTHHFTILDLEISHYKDKQYCSNCTCGANSGSAYSNRFSRPLVSGRTNDPTRYVSGLIAFLGLITYLPTTAY